MKFNMLRRQFATAIFLTLTSGMASAATLTYSSWFSTANGPNPVDLPRTFTDTEWNGVLETITLPKFNSNLGTLTSVQLSFYSDVISTGSLTNTSTESDATVFQYKVQEIIRILAPGTATPATIASAFLLQVFPTSLDIAFGTVIAQNGGTLPFTTNYGDAGSFASTSATYTGGGVSPYQAVGGGSMIFPLFTNTLTTTSISGGNLILTQTTGARAEATIVYTYDTPPQTGTP